MTAGGPMSAACLFDNDFVKTKLRRSAEHLGGNRLYLGTWVVPRASAILLLPSPSWLQFLLEIEAEVGSGIQAHETASSLLNSPTTSSQVVDNPNLKPLAMNISAQQRTF